MNPRWSETPDTVLALVKNCLVAVSHEETCPAMRVADLAAQREAQTAECLGRLKNPLKRTLFRWVLRRAQCGLAIKENVRSELVRRMSQTRLLLLELGQRLVQCGRCSSRDDVFFLTLDELRPDFLLDKETDLRGIVSKRRAEHERNQKLQMPPVIFGSGDPSQWESEPAVAAVDQLEGLAVSPGLATGRARVILKVNPEDRVLPGEILVAPFTDPGWSPYFVTAAGLVADLGGILSHGSILAREYGIPAVTSAGPATRLIRTGDLVEVDGSQGRVRILERASNEAKERV